MGNQSSKISHALRTNRGHTAPTRVLIKWPKDAERARRIVRRSNARPTGKLSSRKNGRQVHWESQLEREAFLLHEVDHTVLSYQEQPAEILFSLRGRTHSHIPDLLVETRTCKIFREIKSDREVGEDFVQERTALLSELLPQYGFKYDLLAESDIRCQPRLDNARFICQHAKFPIQDKERELALAVFREIGGSISWRKVQQGALGKYSVVIACQLFIEGRISLHIDQDISDDAQLSLI